MEKFGRKIKKPNKYLKALDKEKGDKDKSLLKLRSLLSF